MITVYIKFFGPNVMICGKKSRGMKTLEKPQYVSLISMVPGEN